MVNQTTIFSLPVELRDNIVSHLDIKDVLSLSVTCKFLRAIMESRQTWIKFAQKIQLQPQISRIEEPLEDFTTQELREWTLRRHKTCHYLDTGSSATCHYIRGTDDVQRSVLLPGGRWLLLERSLGNIFYADCDARSPEARSLITFGDVIPGYFKTQFVVWRDPDSARLTLRVAILYWYNRDDGDRSYQAHFCKIDLVGHGSSAKLVAKRIRLYQGSVPTRETSGEAIRGAYFYQIHHVQIYGVSPRLLNRRITLEFLNYENGSSVAQQVKLVDFYYSLHRWRLDVLPDGRIAVSGATEADIYPDPLPMIGNGVKTLAPSLAINHVGYTMRGGPVNMSEWYFGLDSHMAVYGAPGKWMIAVSIPHDGAPPMKRIIKEPMPNNIGRCILGLFHGVSMISRGCISILGYPWGDSQNEVGPGGITRRLFKIEQDQDDDIYDVDGGDCVIESDNRGEEEEEEENEGDVHGAEILYFNEESGRAIIQDQRRGYFVFDMVPA